MKKLIQHTVMGGAEPKANRDPSNRQLLQGQEEGRALTAALYVCSLQALCLCLRAVVTLLPPHAHQLWVNLRSTLLCIVVVSGGALWIKTAQYLETKASQNLWPHRDGRIGCAAVKECFYAACSTAYSTATFFLVLPQHGMQVGFCHMKRQKVH